MSNKLNEIFYSLYDEYFTVKQLKVMVAFYSSSAGKQVMKYMPTLSNRSMQEANVQARLVTQKVQQRLLKKINSVPTTGPEQDTESNRDEPVIESHYN